ncbi:MAG: hypothetical protein K6F01_08010 [Selenomonas sp.]|uniref:hypothetical protein n=1 Tax=Selenomonas sp. TaxID=2053611 RepID=UPI0025E2402B|nr:hypothetical protein [Selenomonas sp.]MCR5439355.1 hypothetical protein [Selenomonas sp.]
MKFTYLLYLVIVRTVIEIISTPDDIWAWGELVVFCLAAWWARKKESKDDN